MPIEKKIGHPRAGDGKRRVPIEDVRLARERVKLRGHFRVAKPLEESLAAFDGDRGVRHAVKQDRGCKAVREVRRG